MELLRHFFFLQGLSDLLGAKTNIGIKRMGEIDMKPFQNACKKEFSPEEAEVQATTLCSLWQENLKNSEWHPFKVVDEGGIHKVCCLHFM